MAIHDKPHDAKDIFIVDDHPIVREGLARLVNREVDLKVCGQADDAWKALKEIFRLVPDVVVTDVTLKDSDGIELTKNIKSRYPGLPVVVLSVHDEAIYGQRALRAGASAYLMKEVVSEKIVDAIRAVLRGEIFVSDTLARKALNRLARGKVDSDATPIDDLSDRELQIFRLIGSGYKASEISRQLHLSVKTVESYRARVKEKLGVADAGELLRLAIHWAAGREDK